MPRWIRFKSKEGVGTGVVEGDDVRIASGSMYDRPTFDGRTVKLASLKLLAPCEPTKIIGMWRNFYALEGAVNLPTPTQPLYFLKGTNSLCNPLDEIAPPAGYDGTVVFEGEIAIVIGKRAKRVSEAEAGNYIFGYTCVNDVTALDLLRVDETFSHWTRAKSFDTFCPLGPSIATDLDLNSAQIQVYVDGNKRQDYPVADMIIPPARLVSLISHDMTLFPGDVIAAGTSIGVGRLKPGKKVTVQIEGVGELTNTYGS